MVDAHEMKETTVKIGTTRGFGLIALLVLLLGPSLGGTRSASAEAPEQIRLDYAYYNPSSLVLRHFGWLDEEFKADGTKIEWTLSAGSNKANEALRSEAIDFGSTAGAAALLARANGSPIQTVYVFSKPEWTALVVPKDSTITDVGQLKGKKIAATKGTDPYFFLLRSLEKAGLSGSDVQIVNLQHADGKSALERGQVDAWAGLDPFMAQTEIEAGSRLLYRNIDFNSYGFLNVRSDFLKDHPAETERVLTQYERARKWIQDNPDEAAQILADEAKLSLDVAQRELVERTVLTNDPVPGAEHVAVLEAIIPIFTAENQVKPGTDVEKALTELLAPASIEAVLKQ
jgi:sulfonate transport system substrate-binding protein